MLHRVVKEATDSRNECAVKVEKRRRLWPFHVSYSSSSRRNQRIAKKNLTIVISNIKSHRKTTSGRKKMVVCRTILKMLSVSFIVWVGILEAVDAAPVTGTWIKSRPQSLIQKIELPIRSNRKRPTTADPSGSNPSPVKQHELLKRAHWADYALFANERPTARPNCVRFRRNKILLLYAKNTHSR